MKRYDKELTAEELAALPDSEIDYSDIPETDEAFWAHAKRVVPDAKENVAIKIDQDVLEYFRQEGADYQSRINIVLRSYVEAKKKEAMSH